MQSVVTTSSRCTVSRGLQPSPPSALVIPGRPCLRAGCRVLSSTASLSTWQSTKQFTLVHAPEKRGANAPRPLQSHLLLLLVNKSSGPTAAVACRSQCTYPYCAGSSCRQVTRMGNKSTSGPFVPIVKLTRAAIGNKQFNQLRGKGISLHSQGGPLEQ